MLKLYWMCPFDLQLRSEASLPCFS